MLVLSAAIVAVAILLLAATLAWLERSRRAAARHDGALERGWLERLEVEPVVVELTDKRTIAGYLAGAYTDAVVLRHSRYLGADADAPIGGDVAIPRERIAWLQRGVAVAGLERTLAEPDGATLDTPEARAA